MKLIYDCPNCDKELEGDFGDNVTCDDCNKTYETDWDYVGDSIACWIIGEITNTLFPKDKIEEHIRQLEENPDKQETVDWVKESELCRTNPYYFYTRYVTIDNKPATTDYTEEEFNNIFKVKQNQLPKSMIKFNLKTRRNEYLCKHGVEFENAIKTVLDEEE